MQLALYRCAADASAIDTRIYEVERHDQIVIVLLPVLCNIAEQAIDVLGDILNYYDKPEDVQGAADSGMFNALFEDMVGERAGAAAKLRIADVSFIARWELERKRASLISMAERKSGWALLSECCSMRRRLLKATSGVERVLSEAEGQPSKFGDLYRTERQIAIDARAAYYRFVTELAKAKDEHGYANIGRFVRLGGTGLARLFGRRCYQDLRVEDRREIRRLQERVFDWLRGGQDRREGERLMTDLSAFGSLIMQINRRPVLIEHDREVLRRLESVLGLADTDKHAFEPLLRTIRGRDPGLDQLIDAGVDLHPRWWQAHVTRMLGTLSQLHQ